MSTGIDPDSLIPLYAQLEKILLKRITSGEFLPGDMIPSEIELGSEYGISRITVRKAIEGLVTEGLLTKKRGRGTIVNAPKFVDDTFSLQSFTEKTDQSDGEFSTTVLDVEDTVASSLIALHMGIEEEERVLHIKRLRFSDGNPIGYFENYILGELNLGSEEDYSKSIYRLIEEKCGISIKEAKREISSVLADREISHYLDMERPSPVLSMKTYSYDISGRVVEYSEGFYRADRYQFTVHLKRKKGGLK